MTDLALVAAWQTGDRAAGAELVRRHEGLLYRHARRLVGRADMDDLMQEARIGFLHGCTRFDPAFGVKVPTYALSWARQRLQACALRGTAVHLPPGGKTNKVTYHAQRMAGELGTTDARAILDALGLERSGRLLEAVRFTLRGHDEAAEDMHLTASGPDPGENVDRERLLAEIRAALEVLPERARAIVLRRLDGERLESIGRDLGVSRERVRQIEAQAYSRLREELG
jgi:RNA polymerase primary sigma factor